MVISCCHTCAFAIAFVKLFYYLFLAVFTKQFTIMIHSKNHIVHNNTSIHVFESYIIQLANY